MFQGPVSRKPRKLLVPEKPFVKLRPAYSLTLALSYVVNGWKIKTTVRFCASRCRRFEDTNGIMSPEMRPKSFGTLEKRIPDLYFLLVPMKLLLLSGLGVLFTSSPIVPLPNHLAWRGTGSLGQRITGL